MCISWILAGGFACLFCFVFLSLFLYHFITFIGSKSSFHVLQDHPPSATLPLQKTLSSGLSDRFNILMKAFVERLWENLLVAIFVSSSIYHLLPLTPNTYHYLSLLHVSLFNLFCFVLLAHWYSISCSIAYPPACGLSQYTLFPWCLFLYELSGTIWLRNLAAQVIWG